MLTLARFRLGRVLLHLLAMVGDRCVRFHVAGILRDLGCGSSTGRTIERPLVAWHWFAAVAPLKMAPAVGWVVLWAARLAWLASGTSMG
jgi:hypothetical protein